MKEKILKKFNDSTYELFMLLQATRNNLSDDVNRHSNNLGRILYETFESILKFQIDTNADSRTKKDVNYNISDRKKLLELFNIHKLTLEEDQVDNINYEFLMKTGRLINDSKHKLDDSITTNDLEKFYNEIYKMINIYVDNKKKIKTVSDLEINEINGWDTFYSVCNKFQKESRNYILVLDKFDKSNEQYLKNISLLPWNLIIDFDYLSREEGGFYDKVFAKESPLPTVINLNDNTSTETFAINHQQHYHYFINSYKNSGVSRPNDYDEWQRKYENKFDVLIQNFASKFNFNTKVIFLSDSISDDFVLRIGEIIRKHFFDLVDFVFAINDISELVYPFKKLKGKHVPITVSEISDGISKFSFNFGIKDSFANKIVVPHLEETATSNVSGVLDLDFYLKLENDFEVVHKGLDTKNYDEIEEKRDFLSGFKQISWYGLRQDWDKKHPSLKGLKGFLEIVKNSLKKAKGKLELIHEAGYGGTTLARRIAWEFHNDYPTLILKEYRGQVTVDYIVKLYDQTRKPIFIIIEAPQAITLDEIDTFYRALLGKSRPFLFLIVRRGDSNVNNKNGNVLYLTDWGNQVNDLINEYKPFLKEYNNDVLVRKEKELNEIAISNEGFKKIPFYIGLVTFEEKFFAIRNYVQNFVNEIKTEEQKRIMLYLAMCHDYLGESLPVSFFRTIIKVSSDETIDLEKFLPLSLQQILSHSKIGNEKYWKPRHSLFSKELKIQILQGSDNEHENIWKQNLADFCIKFIEDSYTNERISTNTEGILQTLFIGTKIDRAGEMFTTIVRDIKNEDDKERVFIKLKDTYPENAHYYSHLARFYAYHKKNRENALYFADKAISLSEGQGKQDSLLYHIKGMCLRRAAEDLMRELEENKRNNVDINADKVNEVLYDLVPSAELEFERSRQASKNLSKIDKHGYVAHIQLLIRAIDFGAIISGIKKSKFLAENKQPYVDWLDTAETLLEEIKRNDIESEDNYYISECTNSLNELFEEFSLILQNLNNQLEKGINTTRVRRQIVRIHLRKESAKLEAKTINKILNLMEDNIEDEPSNEKNFYLWFKLARFSNIKLEEAVSKLARWKSNSTALDSIYYFYILKVLRALQGYSDDTIQAEMLIKECKLKSQKKHNVITSFEWYGKGKDLNRLVNLSDIENKEDQLEYVDGYFTSYKHDGHGIITICDKLEVFFSPTQAKLSKDDVGQRLQFFLGFSYDGLRADSSSVRIIK
ncbi:hypothetical protein [Flavobacterium soyae]|uniref:Uncharacterized protein n=1 Tax=Flavobacterium soyae TaxID=2903098 RepID=A0ABZ2UFJ3_9FLAO